MDRCLLLICILAVFEQGWSQHNQTLIGTISPEFNTPTFINITAPECRNGDLLSGFCLCHDDWSGTSCDISNFCSEQQPTEANKFTFPKTFLGQFASSKQPCSFGTPNAGIAQASALCNITTRRFNPPNILECGLTLDKINEKVTLASFEEKKKLAYSTQLLTSIPERLTPNDITNTVKIAKILLSSDKRQESTDIDVSTLATVSQLLNAGHRKFTNVDQQDISQLTQTLQTFSLRKGSETLQVQPNLAVQSIKGIEQVQLTLFKGQNDAFLPDRIRLNSGQDMLGTVPSQKDNVDLQMNIIFNKGFDKDVGFVLYDNDQFFQSQTYKSSLDKKRRVISASLTENHDLNIQFAVTASNEHRMSLHNFACVFWSYNKNDWSTTGCTKKMNFSGHVVCSCKQSEQPKNVNFAILMTFNTDYQYSKALHWISIIGCSLSIVGLTVTGVYQVATRKSRGCSPTLLLVNICLSMTIFYLLFIFGSNNPVKHAKEAIFSEENIVPLTDYHQYSDEGPCTAFTALLHYFLLATFTWNTLYGINVFLLFKATISGSPPWFPKMSLAVGWGFPALVVGISLGSTYRVEEPLGYRQEDFCWLAFLNQEQKFDMRKPMFWSFLLPLVIMLISNTAMLLHFSHNICKTNPNLNKSRVTPLKKKLLSSFSLAVMLGLSWVTGYILLITHDKTLNLILSIIFCICNTTQGIQIFILFTLRSILNSNPAILNALNAPMQDIGLHRKKFFLWKVKVPENRETYTSTNPDNPEVINALE